MKRKAGVMVIETGVEKALGLAAPLYRRARRDGDREAAVELEMRLYMIVIDLAVICGWRLEPGEKGREVLRHAGRIALSRYLDSALWSACRSCGVAGFVRRDGCSACKGSGSLLITPMQFARIVGRKRYGSVWLGRIRQITKVISLWGCA